MQKPGGNREKRREATQKRAALVAQVRYKVNALRIQFNTLTHVWVAATRGERERDGGLFLTLITIVVVVVG